jgi:transposase
MSSVTSEIGLVHLGMDTSKNAIVVGILAAGERVPVIDRIFNDESSIRRLIGRFDPVSRLRSCYEAGPGGYELHRLLTSLGVANEVVAPSLIPKGSGDRVKTDRRDAARLARLYRAGELTAIRVPSAQEEAVRELIRVRADLMLDLRRTKQRLTALLLRHGKIWRAGQYWTLEHRRWLAGLSFDDPALDTALGHYRMALAAREAEVAVIEADLSPWAGRAPMADPVARLTAYRGIGELTALSLVAEVVDWRRFPHARAFMCFTGLVPSEYSSGQTTRRGHITKAGNATVRTALVEAAWKYQHLPAVGAGLRRRQNGLPADTIARAWTAQRRLNSKYRQLINHGKPSTVAATAVARELAGFVWAEMTS